MQTDGRIGIFGGTFDPVHIGHIKLAEAARVQAGLSRVLFMPAHIQPFKQDEEVSSDDDRLRMLRLALAGLPEFEVTTFELDKGGVSYTIDSLRALREEYDAGLCFIIGTDMFLNIEKWHEAEALLREFDFAVGVRPGYEHDEAVLLAELLRAVYGTRIDLIDNAPVELSSTEIRRRVKEGLDISEFVPESVRRFLLVREKVGEKRFEHTKRVIDLAAEMAERFGEDRDKAELAALLHDYDKDPSGGVVNNIYHGAMAAEAAGSVFGVVDEDILNAIRYHTTGRAGMSRLEKIIFLADTVEPGRTYNSIVRLREECLEDLDKGALRVLMELREYLLQKGLEVSPDTEAAIEDLRSGVSK